MIKTNDVFVLYGTLDSEIHRKAKEALHSNAYVNIFDAYFSVVGIEISTDAFNSNAISITMVKIKQPT